MIAEFQYRCWTTNRFGQVLSPCAFNSRDMPRTWATALCPFLHVDIQIQCYVPVILNFLFTSLKTVVGACQGSKKSAFFITVICL